MKFVRRLCRYIRRVFLWARFLWKEGIEEWDYVYILKILQFAIASQRLETESAIARLAEDGICLGEGVQVKQMRICEALIERIVRCDYPQPSWGRPLRKWDLLGDGKFAFEDDCWDVYHDESMQTQDLKLLTDMIRKHLRRWWV